MVPTHPSWMFSLTALQHFFLIVNSSVNFIIYCLVGKKSVIPFLHFYDSEVSDLDKFLSAKWSAVSIAITSKCGSKNSNLLNLINTEDTGTCFWWYVNSFSSFLISYINSLVLYVFPPNINFLSPLLEFIHSYGIICTFLLISIIISPVSAPIFLSLCCAKNLINTEDSSTCF